MPKFDETTVKDYFGFGKSVSGDVGIEIELEAHNLLPPAPAGWTAHADGSLQGNSIEYVSNGPFKIEDVGTHLANVRKALVDFKTRLKDSIRTGVHVHVNCLNLTLDEMLNFALVYLSMERALVRYCGPDREGNLFCLRSSDAEYLIYRLEEDIRNERIYNVLNDNVRYSSINFSSLGKFGTIEFRAMQTFTDLSRIEEWANMLVKMREYAKTIKDRREIAMSISLKSPEVWAAEVLGEYAKLIIYPGFERDVLKDVRNVQSILFMKK